MVLRSLFLTLSRSDTLRDWMVHFGPARRMARRFIAGETLDEAVAVARQLQAQGILTTLDHLGENVATPGDAERAASEYQALLQRIAAEGLPATISVKLTHIGLDFGEEFCCARLRSIAETAQSLGNTLEVDIEGSAYTQATLAVFHSLLDDYYNLRLALQAYLFRTEADLKRLVERGSSVRLCKGAYDESPTIAWKKKADVDASYARLMDMALGEEAQATGFYPALGTHDHNLIMRAELEAARRDIARDRFEFQMLHGIRRDWQQRLARDGYRVRVYVPYGTQWYPYFMRRLAERPANVLFIARAFLGK
jgi:proline dehydrogenase